MKRVERERARWSSVRMMRSRDIAMKPWRVCEAGRLHRGDQHTCHCCCHRYAGAIDHAAAEIARCRRRQRWPVD